MAAPIQPPVPENFTNLANADNPVVTMNPASATSPAPGSVDTLGQGQPQQPGYTPQQGVPAMAPRVGRGHFAQKTHAPASSRKHK